MAEDKQLNKKVQNRLNGLALHTPPALAAVLLTSPLLLFN